MIEKFIDIIKSVFEKYLYKALFSLASAFVIAALKKDYLNNINLSKNELIVVVFCIVFVLLGTCEAICKKCIQKYLEIIATKKKKEEQIQKDKERLDSAVIRIKDWILDLPPCDKDILFEIVSNDNNIFLLNFNSYLYGELFSQSYHGMSIHGNKVNAHKNIDIVRKYLDDEGMTYIEFKLDDEFYEILLEVIKKYGKGCFEY